MAVDHPQFARDTARVADVLCPVVVGRAEELQRVDVQRALALAGGGTAFLLIGEAGVGKSWIVREATARATGDGVPNTIPAEDAFAWGDGATREDNYFVTEESKPARLGSSLGWLLQLDGDDLRNAFLNAPWVKAVLPIRPGQERAALNWLQHVEGTNGIEPGDLYEGPEPEWNGIKTVFEVPQIPADRVAAKYQDGLTTTDFPDPLDDTSTVRATPVDRVYETGFDPLVGGFKANVDDSFEIFDQWVEILPTDQVVAVEVTYDPKTGRQL